MAKGKGPDRDVIEAALMGIVKTQVQSNDPPEARATLARLMREGYSEESSMKLIASALSMELAEVLQSGRAHDPARYAEALHRLPELAME